MNHPTKLAMFLVAFGFVTAPTRAGEAVTWAAASEPACRVPLYDKTHPPATPNLEDLSLRPSVSQYGITWTFDNPARVGQFINGDYYVVGPVTVTLIDPKPLWGDEIKETINKDAVREGNYPGRQARNGSMLNPRCDHKNQQGYRECAGFDSRIPHDRYAPELFSHRPIRMKPGDALVSTISRANDQITKFGGQHVDPLRAAAVLTCLAEPQPPDAFRPSYCDTAHSKVYLARNLRRELLLKLPKPRSAPPQIDAYRVASNGDKLPRGPSALFNAPNYVAACQRPWLDIVEFGFAAPVENLPHYGQDLVTQVGDASLLLHMDYPAEEKERLLVPFIQVGIDFWGLARAGRSWPCHGGLNSGRKWPIVFAGLMLDDPEMQSPTKVLPKLHFHEDDQTVMCPYPYRGKVHERGWTGAKAIFTGHSLPRGGAAGNWEGGWGCVDLYPPTEWPRLKPDRAPASEGYRRANTSNSWIGQALAVRLMHAEKMWDHDAFFAYVDRWMTEDDTPFVEAIKNAGGMDWTKAKRGEFGRQGYVMQAKFVREMWDAWRNALPPAPDGHEDPRAEDTWK